MDDAVFEGKLESSHLEENKLEIKKKKVKVWFVPCGFLSQTPLIFMKIIMNKYRNDPLLMSV